MHGVSEISLTRLGRPQPLFPFFSTGLRRGVREAENQNEEPGFRWLNELHFKIWGRYDLSLTLIKRVKVTRDHYDQLQDILNRKYMGRDDAEYHGDHNVLSDKLEFLWSLPTADPLSPPHPNDDDTEASDEDNDMEASDENDDI